jgi:hypothetical protein
MTDEYKHGCDPKADASTPECDNHSGNYCPDCRWTGLSHCSYPDECGGMRQMRTPEGGCKRHTHKEGSNE